MKSKLLKWVIYGLTIGASVISRAQEIPVNCYENVTTAQTFLFGTDSIPKNETQAIELLKPCADEGDALAQFILGKIYQEGLGVPKDETKAFSYIEKSAEQEYPTAVCELGVLYKDGVGCDLNFNTAIDWFKKAEALGNSQGSYSIGYMYFKGLGSVEQDYEQAIEWFKKSDYPMAKHWLGICNYFGYGMPVEKDVAKGMWLDNPIENSEILFQHLEANPEIVSTKELQEQTIETTEVGASTIDEIIEAAPENEVTETLENTLTKEDVKGDWKGKLMELDWSKNRTNRSFPVQLSFNENTKTKDLDYKLTINDSDKSSYGIFLDNNYYFDDLTIELPRLYQDDTLKYHLDYKALSLNEIEVKEIDHIRYLTAEVTTSVSDWNEPGPPMLLVLANAKTLSDNGQEIDDELLAGLAQMKGDSFIQLYPNPFQSDLLIQYDLAEDRETTEEIHSFEGQFSHTIVSGVIQEKGKHLYHLDGADYANGLYVVRVTANGILHTKLIVKE